MLPLLVPILLISFLFACKTRSPEERLSKARSSRFESLHIDTEANIRKTERLYDVAIDSTGAKVRIFNGYLFTYTFRANNKTIRGRDRTRYLDYPMFQSVEEVDAQVKKLQGLIVRYDTLNPHNSLINLEKTFGK